MSKYKTGGEVLTAPFCKVSEGKRATHHWLGFSDNNLLLCVSFLFYFLMFIYFWETERVCVWAGEGQSETGRQRIRVSLQDLSCQHSPQHRAQTHKLWDHDLSWSQTLNRVSHPGAPMRFFSNNNWYVSTFTHFLGYCFLELCMLSDSRPVCLPGEFSIS